MSSPNNVAMRAICLGRAGDPRYRDRPIVTGAVSIDDLVVLRWLTTTILVVLRFMGRRVLAIYLAGVEKLLALEERME